MRSTFLVVAALLCAVRVFAQNTVGEWTLHKINGRDYVTLDNVSEFYGLADIQRVSNSVTLRSGMRSLKGERNSAEFYINNLKFILSYPVEEQDGKLCISRMDLTKLIEPVLRPSKIKGAEKVDTIILDAGHGGHDKGAYSAYGYEKTFTFDVVQRARILLQQAGFKVHLSRTSDEFISLDERVRFANKFENAIFISVHFNSGGAGTGLETYTLAPRGVPSMMADGPRVTDLQLCAGNAHDAENMALATASHAALVVRSKMYDRGIKRARFVVIRDIKIPGVLIEGGFLSHGYDAKLVASSQYRQQMAQCIVQAVQNYRRAVGPHVEMAGDAKTQGPRVELSPRPTEGPSEGPTVQTPSAH